MFGMKTSHNSITMERILKRKDSINTKSWRQKYDSDVVPYLIKRPTSDERSSLGYESMSSTRGKFNSMDLMSSDDEWHLNVLRTTATLLGCLNTSGNNRQVIDILQYCANAGIVQQVAMADKKQKMLWLEKIEKDGTQYKIMQYVASDLDVPILQAIRLNRNEALEAMFHHGVDVNLIDYETEGWSLTPFHAAVKYGNFKAAKLLLKANADPNQRTCLLQTPLSMALSKGARDFALLFLKHNTKQLNLNREDTFGNTEIFQLLDRKLDKDDTEILEQLILRGADINGAHCKTGMTPLACAVYNYNGTPTIKAIRLLLSRKADPNVKTPSGSTALHMVCGSLSKRCKKLSASKRCEIVQLLLQFQANPNAVDKDYNTPLHLAAYYDYAKVAEILLDYGALDGKRNVDGQMPIDLSRPDSVVFPVLAEHAGRSPSPTTPGLRRNSRSSLFGSQLCLNETPAWLSLRQEVAKYESTLRKFSTRFQKLNDTDDDIMNGRIDSMIDPEELIQEFSRVKHAIQQVQQESLSMAPSQNPFSFLPPSGGNGMIHTGKSHKVYSAFRSLCFLVGHDWKYLFRQLMSSEDPSHTEILICEIEQKYHGQIREQTYQSLHCWYNSCSKRSDCLQLLKNALQELELIQALDQVILIEKT